MSAGVVARGAVAASAAGVGGGGSWQAERVEVTGIVQGVGFRPFVHRLATDLGLDGSVGNDSTRVFIAVAGPSGRLDEFVRRLVDEAPPLAHVETVTRSRTTVSGDAIGPGFRIVDSERVEGARTLVPPDTAVCDDCRRELFDPDDRRFGHPFITCTNCGPRFTIIRDLPYDRPATTMAGFEMCAACAAEYSDPTDRRYHAQPIACPDCGPTLVLQSAPPLQGVPGTPCNGGADCNGAVEVVRGGGTVAIKGLGGFHLACDATSDAAIGLLRERKQRPDKPFAIMVADLDAARAVAHVNAAEEAELTSPARPVVLLRARADSAISEFVAPGNPLVGVMLPYTPIHHLLFAAGLPPLVMTSGNLSGEPIVFRDDEVADRLGHLCDAILTHDRPIHVPCDDSVVRVAGGELLPIRRARGYAPVPVPIDGGRRTVLAVGGELKNTCCLASTDHAWVSQHIGDMEHLPTIEAFESIAAQFRQMYEIEPDVVAVDAHPGYATTRWAHRYVADRYRGDDAAGDDAAGDDAAGDGAAGDDAAGRIVEVQHHHAHIASIMAEHRLAPTERVIGFAFDGTGYGTDGAIWGGEVLAADAAGFDRLAHLAYVPLPGGDAAIRNPYRVALAHLHAAGIDWSADAGAANDLAPVAELDAIEAGLLRRQFATGFSCVPTSSMGRFFDAIASLIGMRQRISFEAQAAIDLELAALRAVTARTYAFAIDGDVISPIDLIRAVVDDVRAGVDAAAIARGVHIAVADVVLRLAERARAEFDLHTVALSGGVFQNALLAELCLTDLRRAGFRVLTHRRVPPNDGGLALGQAYVAAHRPAAPIVHHATDQEVD